MYDSMPSFHHRYRPFPRVELPDRTWPSRQITVAPTWCSVDLRDGNQALIEPMGLERKQRMFNALIEMGFKEIEVGFPAASQPDFDFCRHIIEHGLIPDDVTIQVLCQCRESLIERTFEALRGAKNVILHLYNSTSTLQRRVVFQAGRKEIIDLAVQGTQIARRLADANPELNVRYEYSPESFTGTELDFAIEICEEVLNAWGATAKDPVILNLPATVEMSMPNVYADQIEYFLRNISDPARVILSVHPHNDRGTAVAAAELALLAGAQRIEGTLFGNGERTGNVDVVTLALNMQTQGVDPQLRIDDIAKLIRVAEYCNRLPVHPRHPYAGELVFTAFSGSHQDAIRKGMDVQRTEHDDHWEVPYLPIDPKDIGRSYEAVIRINSQSGKSGVGYILETEFGYRVPKRMLIDFSPVIQNKSEAREGELSPIEIYEALIEHYQDQPGPFALGKSFETETDAAGRVQLRGEVLFRQESRMIRGEGNGVIDAFVHALRSTLDIEVSISDFAEHALGSGSDAKAVAYIELTRADGHRSFGMGSANGTVQASLAAILSALHRGLQSER